MIRKLDPTLNSGFTRWAQRVIFRFIYVIDSSTKFPSGVLDGTLSDFGDYDQCLNIVKEDNRKRVQFTGQYCVVEAAPLLPPMPHRVQFKTVVLDVSNFSQPDSVLSDLASNINMFYLMKLRLGLCMPSTCSVTDVQEIAKLGPKREIRRSPTCLSINRLWHELCDMLRRLVGTTAPGHHDCSIQE
ncbi:NRF domain-containing protein [Trichonephila clavipes]|nr:NRF domain-containing protein [Trichonephila clavipes]